MPGPDLHREPIYSAAGCCSGSLSAYNDPVPNPSPRREMPRPLTSPEADTVYVEVSLRPGVTDPAAHEIVRAAHQLGLTGVRRAATGTRFLLTGLPAEEIDRFAKTLLADPVVGRWKISGVERRPCRRGRPPAAWLKYFLSARFQTMNFWRFPRNAGCPGSGRDAGHSKLFHQRKDATQPMSNSKPSPKRGASIVFIKHSKRRQ